MVLSLVVSRKCDSCHVKCCRANGELRHCATSQDSSYPKRATGNSTAQHNGRPAQDIAIVRIRKEHGRQNEQEMCGEEEHSEGDRADGTNIARAKPANLVDFFFNFQALPRLMKVSIVAFALVGGDVQAYIEKDIYRGERK